MIQALIFDLDETLVDSRESIMLYYRELFKFIGYPLPPESEWHLLYTLPERESLRRFAGGDESWLKALEFKKKFDFSHSRKLVKLKPYAKHVLEWASERYLLALATNRGGSVWELIDELGIAGFFQLVFNAENSKHLKPDPWVVNEVCRQFSLQPYEVAFIGDSEPDIICAKNAGAISVAVGDLWQKGKVKPDYYIQSLKELPYLLEKL